MHRKFLQRCAGARAIYAQTAVGFKQGPVISARQVTILVVYEFPVSVIQWQWAVWAYVSVGVKLPLVPYDKAISAYTSVICVSEHGGFTFIKRGGNFNELVWRSIVKIRHTVNTIAKEILL